MNNRTIMVTFFEIHELQLKEQQLEAETLLRKSIQNISTPIETAMFTWLLSEQMLRFGSKQLMTEYEDFISLSIQEIEQNWNKDQEHLYLPLTKDVFTLHLSIYYATLMSLKNLGYNPKVQQTATAIRDRVFAKHLKGGMLICSAKHPFSSTDLVLSVLPFGLFSPEDLVMVEAVKEIENHLVQKGKIIPYPFTNEHDDMSAALLSWYFLEKGDRAKFEHYDQLIKDTSDNTSLYIKRVIDFYQLLDQDPILITHEPLGNGNKYEPQVFERFPRVPIEGEEVFIQFKAPYSYDASARVHVETPSETRIIEAGYVPGENPYWKVNIGSFPKHEKVTYSIEWIDREEKFTTSTYSFYPLAKIEIRKLVGKKVNEDRFQFWPESNVVSLLLDIDISNEVIQIDKTKPVVCSDSDDTLNLSEILSLQGLPKLYDDPYFAPIRILVDRHGNWSEVSVRFYSPLKERFFGMGERYHRLEYRGEELDCYVYNQYRDQGARTYLPIPFFFSSMGYGLHVNTSRYTRFDFAKSYDDLLNISICQNPEETISIQYFNGSPFEIVSKYTKQTGPAEMLPTWAFGPWMSSNNWDREEVVKYQVQKTTELQIPSTVLVLEQWSDEATYYIFNDAIYQPTDGSTALSYKDYTFPEWGRWPNPKELVKYINDHGMELILWQIPIMKYLNRQHHLQKDNDESFMLDKQYYIKDNNKEPYRIPEGWFKESLLMDFSNQEGAKWWFDKRKYLLDIGVAGFKTDGGEMVFGEQLVFADQRIGSEMRNAYPNDYIKAYYDFSQEHRPNNAMTFSRAGYTGAQQFPAHWAGDERSTFDAFKRSLIAGLSSGLSGVIMWGWDLAGFNGEVPTVELFIRSAQMAAFCPIMQYHAESKAEFNQDRTPWNIADRTKDDRAISGYRFFANLRMNLLPYIVEQAKLSAEAGIPLMRAMVLQYSDDPKTYSMYDQYFFGEHLLVAPIIEEGVEKRSVYLPKNKWVNLFNKQVFNGSRFVDVEAPLMEIPVFQKNNSCIISNVSKDEATLGSYVGSEVNSYNYPLVHIVSDNTFISQNKDHLNETWVIEVIHDNNKNVFLKVESCHHGFSIVYTNTSEDTVILFLDGVENGSEVESNETIELRIE